MAPPSLSALTAVKLPSRLLGALRGVSSPVFDEVVKGFEQLASITKRTEDVAMNLDKLLPAGLVPVVLYHLRDEALQERFPDKAGQESAQEALHLAACAVLGELVWTRDCAPEVRPVVLADGGMGALAGLIESTSSERLRLRALVVCRRMLYEVGSTARMDAEAIKAASSCRLVERLVDLLPRVVDSNTKTFTIDTLEAVTYLLQRMMVCLDTSQQEQLQLSDYMQSAARVMVTHLHTTAGSSSNTPETQRALCASLLAVRELSWDDHNSCIEPGMGAMSAAGAFEAVAGLMAPLEKVAEGAKSQTPEEAKQAIDAPPPLARGVLSKATCDMACALLNKLAAVPEGTLPEILAAQVPRFMHNVIAALVEHLDGRFNVEDGEDGHDEVAERQERALSALRKLLLIENSEIVPPAAAEAADAQGVPACLRSLALSCPEFVGSSASISATVGMTTGGQLNIPRRSSELSHRLSRSSAAGDRAGKGGESESGTQAAIGGGAEAGGNGEGDGEDDGIQLVSCNFPTAVHAAALLADLTASSALAAAANGQPGLAAAELREVESVVVPLISHADTDQAACRNFAYTIYQLSLVHYRDAAPEDDSIDASQMLPDPSSPTRPETLTAPGAVATAAALVPAPPEEEQYSLSSELVTLMGRVADGMNGLLAGGGCGEARSLPSRASLHSSKNPSHRHKRSQSSESIFSCSSNNGISVLSRLQRVTQLVHELVGLRIAINASPVSKHNLDALFVHGSMQALFQQLDVYYANLRVWLKARKEEKEKQDAQERQEAEANKGEDADGPVMPVRPITAYLEKPPPSALMPLLHHETGVLELIKELVRDVPDARIKLRDIGALPSLARMLNDNRRDNLLVSLQFNLARSEAIHTALKQTGCVALMESVLMEPPCGDGAQYDVRQLLALCTLGLVAGEDVGMRFSQAQPGMLRSRSSWVGAAGEDDVLKSKLRDGKKKRSERDAWALRAVGLLESFDMADLMQRVMRDACKDGKYIISSSTSAWPFMLEPAALTVQSLARSDAMARRLAENDVPALMISALGNKHGSAPEAALCITRALLNFARVPDLRPNLLHAGCVDALEPFTYSDNLCIADAAKGCLLQLGELPDAAARSALEGSTPEALAPVLQVPLPCDSSSSRQISGSGTMQTQASSEEQDNRRMSSFISRKGAPLMRKGSSLEAAQSAVSATCGAEPVVDVLISYKRMDAHTFALMLHTALVLRGVGCLLDYEYKPDLSDVEQVVARCRTLLLILTDNVLNSERCLTELEAAARHSVHVVIVVKEGARWGDSSGRMVSYPPPETIRTLKPAVQTIFARKAVHHREEHYGYFITQLMKRLKRSQPAQPQMRQSRPQLRMSMAGGGDRLQAESSSGAPFGGGLKAEPSSGNTPFGDMARKRMSALNISSPASEPPLPSPSANVSNSGAAPWSGVSLQPGSAQQEQHAAALDGISAQVSMLRQMLTLNAGQQEAIQALQSDVALVRREVVAEVASSSRQLATTLQGELAAWSQQIRGNLSCEAAEYASALAAAKSDIMNCVQTATASLRAELGQEMALNIRHLAADVAELRQGMSLLLSQQQQPQQGNLMTTSMPSMGAMAMADALRGPSPNTQARPHLTSSCSSDMVQLPHITPHPPPSPPGPESAPHTHQASTSPASPVSNGGPGSLLPPIGVTSAIANGANSPTATQGRHMLSKSGPAGATQSGATLPHTLVGNNGNLASVGSVTPNVGGFAGPRLLAAQHQQYQQQRAMQAHALTARSKAGL